MSSTDSPASAYEISTDPARLDVKAIHAYLTSRTGRPGFRSPPSNARCAIRCASAIYERASGAQVGFTRVVTDHATFAYLCDVYVLEAHRGHGLAKRMMREVMAHPALTGARRIMLATRDAHGLYRQSGFVEAGREGNLMEIVRPDMYGA